MNEIIAPATGVVTCLDDLQRFTDLLLCRNTQDVLSEAALSDMTQPSFWVDRRLAAMGLGVLLLPFDESFIVWHNGAYDDFRASLLVDQAAGCAAVALGKGLDLNLDEVTAHALLDLREVSSTALGYLTAHPTIGETPAMIQRGSVRSGVYVSRDRFLRHHLSLRVRSHHEGPTVQSATRDGALSQTPLISSSERDHYFFLTGGRQIDVIDLVVVGGSHQRLAVAPFTVLERVSGPPWLGALFVHATKLCFRWLAYVEYATAEIRRLVLSATSRAHS